MTDDPRLHDHARDVEGSDRESAARRPRPKRERPAPPLRGRRSRRHGRPSSRLASPRRRSSSGRLAPWFAVRGCGRPDMEVVIALVMADAPRLRTATALGSLKFVDHSGKSASRPGSRCAQNTQPNQPHAPDRRRRFSLAVRWSCSPAPPSDTQTCAKARQTAMKRDLAHGCGFPSRRS